MGTQLSMEEKMKSSIKGMLISKDEEIKTSAVYVGYLILKELGKKKDGKISIYDIGAALKKEGIIHGSRLVFALMFLYSTGIVDFKEPYIYKLSNNA